MSDTAIVSEQSGETRSRGSALHFREAKRRGQTRKQYACTDVKASAHGVLPRRSAGKHQEPPQVIARDSTKDKKPAATRALSLPVLPRKETAERK